MNNKSIVFGKLMEKVKAIIDIVYIKLPIPISGASPICSAKTMELHYGILYKNYVDKVHDTGEEFPKAGAILHTLYFEQFARPDSIAFDGMAKVLIDKKYGSFSSFRKEFIEKALEIHGSGWVYMDTSGNIKTIPNHEIINNVAIIVDMWEHSYILDYGSDKEKYLKDIWRIINWDIVNARLNAA